jgi:adenylosuccinate synthase
MPGAPHETLLVLDAAIGQNSIQQARTFNDALRLTGLVITKLDVLTGIDPLHVAVRYLGPEGATFDSFPYHQSILHKATGDLVELPGWDEDVSGARSLDELPRNAQAYLEYISEFLGIPIVMVGVGPGREEMIWTGAAEVVRPAAA